MDAAFCHRLTHPGVKHNHSLEFGQCDVCHLFHQPRQIFFNFISRKNRHLISQSGGIKYVIFSGQGYSIDCALLHKNNFLNAMGVTKISGSVEIPNEFSTEFNNAIAGCFLRVCNKDGPPQNDRIRGDRKNMRKVLYDLIYRLFPVDWVFGPASQLENFV
ncbi:MAG: hypothetical protein P8Y68_20790, partial [Anaerolineales bacterium]